MDQVFLLWHVHTLSEGDDEKLIGVYRSEDEAIAARTRLSNKPGFSDNIDGFLIDAYELDRDHWTDGYVVV